MELHSTSTSHYCSNDLLEGECYAEVIDVTDLYCFDALTVHMLCLSSICGTCREVCVRAHACASSGGGGVGRFGWLALCELFVRTGVI